MSGDDLTGVIFGMGVLVLGTIILVVVLTQTVKFLNTRAERASESRFIELNERYESLGDTLRARQESNATDLAEIRARVGEIERLLREVG